MLKIKFNQIYFEGIFFQKTVKRMDFIYFHKIRYKGVVNSLYILFVKISI